MVVGLSGKMCSGKNYVAKLIAEQYDFELIDVDKIGHIILEQEKESLFHYFGDKIRTADNKIDRKSLGSIVFADKDQLKQLEKIVHPAMVKYVEQKIISYTKQNVLINAAILYKMGLYKLCDKIIWVNAPLWIRFKRCLKRDSLSFSEILKRIWNQRDLNANQLKKIADIQSIRNSYGELSILKQLKPILGLKN